MKKILSESCGCNSAGVANIHGFKAKMIKEKTNNIRWSEVLSTMSADLNELNTFGEFISKLKAYVKRLGFPYFYLCLCEDKQLLGELKLIEDTYQLVSEGISDYTEKINVAIAYENGIFYDSEEINRRKLLPGRFFSKQEEVFCVIMPIHFRLHCMGYCVVGNSSFPLETIQFQSWVMNFGNGLENIRKQMLMQDMINQLNRMWIYDTMTGVLNRAGFYSKAEDLVHKCREQKEQLLLLFIDADRLKAVNDTYGHEEGDFYIKTIAKACQQSVSSEALVMRYGGDEFVILKKYLEADSYFDYMNQIKEAVYQVRENENKPYIMDVSIGHYISDVDHDFKLETIVEQADKDMYVMKKSKRVKQQNEH